MFSGIGGFELGIKQAYENLQNLFPPGKPEYETESTASLGQGGLVSEPTTRLGNPLCVGYSEIDKYAIQVYQSHFDHTNYGNATTINPTELPDFDLLVGGFPCQSFSIAGKRRGFEDTRGTLFFDIARILRAKQPASFILENVKGLLSHDNGKTFRTIIATLTDLGYDLQWQVLNSKDFGVPQNRERVYIIGHIRGQPRPKVFPIGESNTKSIVQLNQPTHSNNRIYGGDGISPTINTAQGGNRQPKIVKTVRSGGRASPHGSKQNWDSYEYQGKIRRLTPLECERLQGFPDGWTLGESDTQRYKCLGNAVTVNTVQAVMEKLFNSICTIPR